MSANTGERDGSPFITDLTGARLAHGDRPPLYRQDCREMRTGGAGIKKGERGKGGGGGEVGEEEEEEEENAYYNLSDNFPIH